MSAFETFTSAWFAAAWRTSWQVAVLALLVLFVTRSLRGRLSARWTYLLWGLVAVRLAVPASPRLTLGAFDWDRATGSQAVLSASDDLELATLALSSPRVPRIKTGPTPAAKSSEEAPVAARSRSFERSGWRGLATHFDSAAEAKPLGWTTWAFLVWVLGATLKLSLILLQELRFRRHLALEPEIADPDLRALVDECRADLGLSREVRLVRSELTPCPALAGLRRPTVLLPEHVTHLGRDDLRGVLLHELAHAKHADVAGNALLALLGCVWWFHPLVDFAFGELRTARESLRDREVLSTPRSPAPLSYAETLLALAEVRPSAAALAPGFSLETRETRRRIQMIADFRTKRSSTQALGAALFLGLAWLTFTSAATPLLPPQETEVAQQDEVQVVRHEPEPAWRAELELALEQPISAHFDETYCDDVVAYLRQQTGANFIVQRDLFSDHGVDAVSFEAQDVRVRDILDLLCQSVGGDITYALTDRVVYIGERGNIPLEHDLRFYKVAPLLDNEREFGDMDDLVSLVQMLSAEGTWEHDGVMIESWNGLMLVTQSHEGHESVKALLDRLLRGGQREARAQDLRTAEVARRLRETKTSVAFDEVPIAIALSQLSLQTGLPLHAEDWIADEFISLELHDVSVEQTLQWMARQQGVHLVPGPAGARLSELAPCTLEFYDLTTLQGRAADPEELRWSLVDLIRNQVEVELWDADPSSCIVHWDQFMLVRATAPAHVGVARMIDALEEVTK